MIQYIRAWVIMRIPERIRSLFMETLTFCVQPAHLVAYFCWGMIIGHLAQRGTTESGLLVLERVYGIQSAHMLVVLFLVGLLALARAHDDIWVAACTLVTLGYVLILYHLWLRGFTNNLSILAIHYVLGNYFGMAGMLLDRRAFGRILALERRVSQIRSRRMVKDT